MRDSERQRERQRERQGERQRERDIQRERDRKRQREKAEYRKRKEYPVIFSKSTFLNFDTGNYGPNQILTSLVPQLNTSTNNFRINTLFKKLSLDTIIYRTTVRCPSHRLTTKSRI